MLGKMSKITDLMARLDAFNSGEDAARVKKSNTHLQQWTPANKPSSDLCIHVDPHLRFPPLPPQVLGGLGDKDSGSAGIVWCLCRSSIGTWGYQKNWRETRLQIWHAPFDPQEKPMSLYKRKGSCDARVNTRGQYIYIYILPSWPVMLKTSAKNSSSCISIYIYIYPLLGEHHWYYNLCSLITTQELEAH